MTIVVGIERGRYGSKIMPGQSASGKYPGLIDCGGGIYRKPFVWRNRQGRERSGNYYYVETNCGQCQKRMLQDRENSKKSKNAFCSAECRKQFIHASSAGRVVIKKREHGAGHHVQVKMHGHPRSGRHNLVFQHILVAEEKIGRPVTKDERIHHINLVKSDNTPANLFVCANNGEHLKIHGSLNHCVSQLIEMGALRFDPELKSYVVVQP